MPRPPVKKRSPNPIEKTAADIAAGFGDLKRQTGVAVEKVKSGYRRIKDFVKK